LNNAKGASVNYLRESPA